VLVQSDHFPFLGVNNVQAPMMNMHCRTTFYTALGRLLMVELGEDEEQFERFMMPLRGRCCQSQRTECAYFPAIRYM